MTTITTIFSYATFAARDVSWFETARDDSYRPYCMGSRPYNPACSVSNPNCSTVMCEHDQALEKLCFWHSKRIGTVEVGSCDCREFKVACGDSTGRRLVRQFYGGSFAIMDTSNSFHCCVTSQNWDNDIGRCGDLRVCEECKDQHPNLVLYNE